MLLFLWIPVLFLSVLPAAGDGDDPIGSKSPSESKKNHLFIGQASAAPTVFTYQGKKITIQKPWIEHSLIRQSDKHKIDENNDILCFRLLIDGRPQNWDRPQPPMFSMPRSDAARYHAVWEPKMSEKLKGIFSKKATKSNVRHLICIRSKDLMLPMKLRIQDGDEPERFVIFSVDH